MKKLFELAGAHKVGILEAAPFGLGEPARENHFVQFCVVVLRDGDQVHGVVGAAAAPGEDVVGLEVRLAVVRNGEHCAIAEVALSHAYAPHVVQIGANLHSGKLPILHIGNNRQKKRPCRNFGKASQRASSDGTSLPQGSPKSRGCPTISQLRQSPFCP